MKIVSGLNPFLFDESKRISKAVEELKADMGTEGEIVRGEYLYAQIDTRDKELQPLRQLYSEMVQADSPYIERHSLSNQIAALEKEFKKLNYEFNTLIGIKRKGEITDEMIERARGYPIGDIVQVNSRGFALCVNHDDTNPSMFCKGNFAHCFSCGWSGDVIALKMKVGDMDFKSAVKRLS